MITSCKKWLLQDKCPWFPSVRVGSIACHDCAYFRGRRPLSGEARNGQLITVKCLKEDEEEK